MLLSYDDFRSRFEALGIAEQDARARLEVLEAAMDPFVIAGIEGKKLGTDSDGDTDPAMLNVELELNPTPVFKDAAIVIAAGKKA